MCSCERIIVTLKNNALAAQRSREGIYRQSSVVNGKTSWVSKSQAIWYNQELNEWAIGPLDYIGTIYTAISSEVVLPCPFDNPSEKWIYVQNELWKCADANEINVLCLTE